MNGTLSIEPPTSIEETTNQWKGERWHEENENDNNNIIVVVDDEQDENLINNDDDILIKIIKAKDQIQQQSDERMNGCSSFYKNLNHISDNDFIGRQHDDLQDSNYVNGHYDEEEDQGEEEDDVEEECEEEIGDDDRRVGHELDDEDEDDDDVNRDDEEYICEYYSDGDGGDDKQEILKRNHGDGIIAKLIVGWYIFLFLHLLDIVYY